MVNLQDPQFLQNPYPFYRHIQEQPGLPENGDGGHWVSRYAEVSGVLRDRRFGHGTFFSEEGQAWLAQNPVARLQAHWMVFMNPPDHRRLRRLTEHSFTPARIRALEPRIHALVRDLLEPLSTRPEIDLIADFAIPFPVTVIAELLGIPEADRTAFQAWSNALAPTLEIAYNSPEVMARANSAALEMRDYLATLAEVRRADPQGDLLSALVQAQQGVDSLSADELFGTCSLLLVAGHETTTNLIGNGMLALLRHPEQLERLRQHPELLENAVEELLRFDAPVQFTSRLALEDTEVGGMKIPRGGWVTLMLGGANRDPAQFENPDALDIARAEVKPLSFGHGIHYCLGAPLARTEGAAAFRGLLEHFPHLRLKDEAPAYKALLTLRGLERLPLVLSEA